MNVYKKVGISFFALILFFIGGVFVGYAGRGDIDKVSGVFNKEPAFSTPVDFDPFWKVWNLLDSKYVNPDTISDQEKLWGAIDGMTKSLGDPYTDFLDPDEAKEFNQILEGEISGIGAEIDIKDGFLTVIAPVKDSPAEKAGIKSGDIILNIDGKPTNEMSIDEAIDLIRGDRGTSVLLTVANIDKSEVNDISIVRDTINIPAVESEVVDDVFIIHIYDFNQNATVEFQNALREFLNTPGDKLVIDVRGNPGGYLDAAIDIASWFLPSSKVIVREAFGDGREDQEYRSKGYNIFKDKDVKVVILADGGSASASEIVAGALKEHKVATLIGTQTFGKGSVQELVPVTYDTYLKVTIAKWLTPNGVSISEFGLTPDIEVPFAGDVNVDNQLQYAIDYLHGRL